MSVPTIHPPLSDAYPTTSRQGRDHQVYTAEGSRIVVGVVPVIDGKVVLVSSRRRDGEWVLPKGGWEDDETQTQSALREAYEEGGLQGHLIGETLGEFHHTRVLANGAPQAVFVFYEMLVEKMVDSWPEAAERERRLFTLEEALEKLSPKRAMADALRKCSLCQRLQ